MIDKGSRYVRIGDAEREAAASSLGEHFAAGRLTHDEFDERLEQAWAARVGADLEPLFADLPPDRTMAKAARQQQAPPPYPAWAYSGRPPLMRRPAPPFFPFMV